MTANFYPRPPRGGRPGQRHCADHLQNFYPRPPRGGRPCSCRRRVPPAGISIHALREEGDALQPSLAGASFYFYPRPPRGGRRSFSRRTLGFFRISIHALREEGDVAADAELYVAEKFLSTPSARRATRRSEQSRHVSAYFYPRPPRGGRRLVLLISAGRIYFYPRPPRGGRRGQRRPQRPPGKFLSTPSARRATAGHLHGPVPDWISIHALREEGDFSSHMDANRALNFYPRPPRGGRHDTIGGQNVYTIISIHALREEGDATGIPSSKVLRDFYPRPPRGGRPRQRQQQTEHGKFLSTPSARRATILSSAPRAVDWISIHALREEGDLMWQDT